jgi:hypothetical protein
MKRFVLRPLVAWFATMASLCFVPSWPAAEIVGERPYEMVWAHRTNDSRPPLVDFENLNGWTVTASDAVASFMITREQQLWGEHVGRLTYRAEGKSPRVTVQPPQPVPVPAPFDSVSLWLYGNNWGWMPDPATPPVQIKVVLRSRTGQSVLIELGSVRWHEWWLMHRKLNADEQAKLKDGALFVGLEITNGHNRDDRVIYFDNLAIYKESLLPLSFPPRRKRGVDPFPGQSAGINTGPGRLPFATREETILPDNLAKDFKVTLAKSGSTFVFTYRGHDGELQYRYEPKTGTLGDVSARWSGRGGPFQPMAGGGVFFAAGNQSVPPDKLELLHCERVADTVVSRWRCTVGNRTAEVAYTFRLWQKSLVVDVKCLGGAVGEFRIGQAMGLGQPRLVTLPYMGFAGTRPAVVVAGAPTKPLFLFALLDYYRSNGSELWARNLVLDGAIYNGGSRYLPKTNGKRNDCFERLFVTVSPHFEEVLPNIPNPKSPWMGVAGESLWIAHGAGNRQNDYNYWRDVARFGMTKIVITDHETGWRDDGESFTFRTRAAPKKGGDPGQAEYARKIRALGFRYGIYNNYTDYAPVNEFWNEDMVTRQSDDQWREAWPRCYNPKPTRAVEYEARLAPIIQQKFHLDTAYCDVHTAVAPWTYVDYDARVPGAGTFADTLYAYGEIMLHQKATWNGPVYSEGSHHWFYCGLTDGNYGQDQAAQLPVNPWLVDFDLRKLHPLCCNFGMGNPEMFFGQNAGRGATAEETEAMFDRFLAATLAFGHTGFFHPNPAKPDNGVRSYFALQQIHAHYAQAIAEEIRYADEKGNLLDVSAAVATGAYRRSQIATRYSNGMRVVVNGHRSETWKTADAELPPNGWFARSEDGKLIAWSANVEGHRADYVDSAAYLYADGRGRFTRFAKAAGDGQFVAHRRAGESLEVIPVGKCENFGVSFGGRAARAVALDKDRREIGTVPTRLSRGLVYVTPTNGAFSYLLTPVGEPDAVLRCQRVRVVAGETVTVLGRTPHRFTVPATAEPGKQLWQKFEDAWIDFSVAPLADTKLAVADKFILRLTSHLPKVSSAQVILDGQTRAATLVPEQESVVEMPFAPPAQETSRPVRLRIAAGELQQEESWQLTAHRSLVPVVPMPEKCQTGQCFRKKSETEVDSDSGALAHPENMPCGGVSRRGLFMHPPYKGGVGYTFALYDSITLPRSPLAAFRCDIGKMDGSDRGDGVLFRVVVVDSAGRETVIAEKQWAEHAWTPLTVDLRRWAGQSFRLKLVSDVGPADNSSGDWSCWANMRLESQEPVMQVTVRK